MSLVVERIAAVRARVAAAERRAGRPAGSVRLVAVSKGFAAAAVAEAVGAGLRVFGENRVQEAAAKIPAVAALCDAPLEWHLIGALQRNKARRAAELFDCVQSVDRLELAEELSRAALARGRVLAVLLQVNVDEEPQKAGVAPRDAAALLAGVDPLAGLRVAGLMAIPRARPDAEQVRASFARLRELRAELDAGRADERRLRELSMGMSGDFEVAIEEGATCVRVGSAIFGERSAA